MTTARNLERRLADHFVEEAPHRAPDGTLPSALATIESTRQRRGLLAPWRFPDMQIYAKLAAGVAVIAIAAVGVWLAGPGTGGPRPPLAPTPSSALSPAPTVRTESAALFVPPFDYTLPAEP